MVLLMSRTNADASTAPIKRVDAAPYLSCVEFDSAKSRADYDKTGEIPSGSWVSLKSSGDCKGVMAVVH